MAKLRSLPRGISLSPALTLGREHSYRSSGQDCVRIAAMAPSRCPAVPHPPTGLTTVGGMVRGRCSRGTDPTSWRRTRDPSLAPPDQSALTRPHGTTRLG